MDIINNGQDNILIEGDNYPMLVALNTIYPEGCVDVIYIDPPYNTGNKDFQYNDKFIDEDDGFKHTKWLNFIESRLTLAKGILKDDGIIYISIDEHEFAQLKLLCDQIFGEKNFISNVVWYKNNSKGNVKQISTVTEYILCYAKNIDNLPEFKIKKQNAEEMCSVAHSMFEKNHHDVEKTNLEFRKWMKEHDIEAGEKKYNKVDENGRLYTDKPLTAPGSTLYYEIIHPITHKPCKTASRGWAYKKESYDELERTGHILFGKDESTCPYLKYFLDENLSEVPTNHIQITANNAVDLQSLGFNKEQFNYPKPVGLIKHLLSMTSTKDGEIVMDFFAGSGTTAQAVLELNKEDGGNRRFILCTNNENNIMTEVCYPRIKTVLTGIRPDGSKYSDGLIGNLRYFKVDFVEDNPYKEQAKYNLADQCDGLLCILESCFDKCSTGKDYNIYLNSKKDKCLSIFNNNYEENEFDEMLSKAASNSCKENVVYYFSLDSNVDTNVEKVVKTKLPEAQVKPIPSKIYEIYKKIADDVRRKY